MKNKKKIFDSCIKKCPFLKFCMLRPQWWKGMGCIDVFHALIPLVIISLMPLQNFSDMFWIPKIKNRTWPFFNSLFSEEFQSRFLALRGQKLDWRIDFRAQSVAYKHLEAKLETGFKKRLSDVDFCLVNRFLIGEFSDEREQSRYPWTTSL